MSDDLVFTDILVSNFSGDLTITHYSQRLRGVTSSNLKNTLARTYDQSYLPNITSQLTLNIYPMKVLYFWNILTAERKKNTMAKTKTTAPTKNRKL